MGHARPEKGKLTSRDDCGRKEKNRKPEIARLMLNKNQREKEGPWDEEHERKESTWTNRGSFATSKGVEKGRGEN